MKKIDWVKRIAEGRIPKECNIRRKKEIKEKHRPKPVFVLDMRSGLTFELPSVKVASEELGIAKKSIYNAIHKGYTSQKKYCFDYALEKMREKDVACQGR